MQERAVAAHALATGAAGAVVLPLCLVETAWATVANAGLAGIVASVSPFEADIQVARAALATAVRSRGSVGSVSSRPRGGPGRPGPPSATVLSNDSDFAVFGGLTFCPLQHLSLTDVGVTCRGCTSDGVAAAMKVPQAALPTLACLVGNDFVG